MYLGMYFLMYCDGYPHVSPPRCTKVCPPLGVPTCAPLNARIAIPEEPDKLKLLFPRPASLK